MNALVVGSICIALVLAGTWFGSVLVKEGRVGLGVAVFLCAALWAGVVTDNIR